jgi:hypothetical protein
MNHEVDLHIFIIAFLMYRIYYSRYLREIYAKHLFDCMFIIWYNITYKTNQRGIIHGLILDH